MLHKVTGVAPGDSDYARSAVSHAATDDRPAQGRGRGAPQSR